MSITYTLRRRDSRSFTGAGSGVTFTVATGTRGPNLVSDATALGSLTDASADAPFLLAGNAAGTAARKVTLGAVARSFLGATTQAAGRTAIDAEQAGTATSAVAAHLAAVNPHTQYALLAAANTFATGPQVFVGGATVRQTGGVAGTHEGLHAHGGSTDGYDIRSMSGPLWLRAGQSSGNILFSRASDGTGANSAVVAVMGGVPRVRLRADVPLTWSASAGDTLGTGDTELTRNAAGMVGLGSTTNKVVVGHNATDGFVSSKAGYLRLAGTRVICQSDTTGVPTILQCGTLIVRTTGGSCFEVNEAAQASLASNMGLSWSSTTDAGSGFDTRIRRSAAGVLDIDNGTAGQYRDLRLRTLLMTNGTQIYDDPTYGMYFQPATGKAEWLGQLTVNNNSTGGDGTKVPIKVRGNGSQTGNLTEWQNSGATVLAGFTAAGRLLFNAADTAPADGVTPAQWLTCTVNGVQYRLPLYL